MCVFVCVSECVSVCVCVCEWVYVCVCVCMCVSVYASSLGIRFILHFRIMKYMNCCIHCRIGLNYWVIVYRLHLV